MVTIHSKAWQRQELLKKQDLPSIDEIYYKIGTINFGKVNVSEQTRRAKALVAMYYLTGCRASEILKTPRLPKQRMKVSTIFDEGVKKKIYQIDSNQKPIIEKWIEEHEFMGTRGCDIKQKEYYGISCLEIRIENRKNKNRRTKLLPIPIEKERKIVQYLYDHLNTLKDDEVIFKFSRSRAMQIINQTLGYNIHFIRHIRATHLITEYDFNEQMLIKFMGWTDSRPAKAYMELRSSDLVREFYKGERKNGN